VCGGGKRRSCSSSFKVFLAAGKGEAAQSEVARAFGMEEGAVRVAVHRLRKRYRILLRAEIAQTLERRGHGGRGDAGAVWRF
jgi:transposase-like protein